MSDGQPESGLSQLSLYYDSVSSMTSPSTSLPRSKMEEMCYYVGLPSSPKLVCRTGATLWMKPTGLEAYWVPKELRPVFGHSLNNIWKDFGPKLCDFLDSMGVLWTTIDVVRFVNVGKGEAVGPVVLWIRGTLDLLEKFGISDVEVEIRESIYTRLAGPSLLKPVRDIDPTADPRLIAEGTGGFYLAQGGDSKNILLVTAHHVFFPPDVDYAHTNISAPRLNAFDNLIKFIKTKSRDHSLIAAHRKRQIEKLQKREAGDDKGDAKRVTWERETTQWLLDQENEAMVTLDEFHHEVKKNWSRPSQRVLGRIVRSAPLTLGAGEGKESFTEDYAIVELDSSKIEKAFRGNVIDLGTKIPMEEFTSKMYPRADASTTFKYPDDRLLKLHNVITESEMSNPDMLSPDGQPCLLAVLPGIFSFVREYYSNGTHKTSTEWAILPYDCKSGVFSAPGDSGSVIVDDHGHFGASSLAANGFPDAYLYPAMA
ncbi:hypothetical protein BS47DRAFT_1348022 [Hydnum rufescens UP504]|uniref:Uncharacterized protein n=1 Tax=Hydnum rufescens UP504 TaxID=1448309 RepID=A0A9P6AR90_9AGAM|nr:hypothetical protein BS47DRAFT_1348022 [Hydnum rufescens UP504]